MSSSEEYSSDEEEEESKEKDPLEINWKDMENIRVVCRFRPINSREKREEKTRDLQDSPPQIIKNQLVKLIRPDTSIKTKPMEFILDHIFPSNTTQQQCFLYTGRPMVEACLHGFNSTLFAYGQTGAGKSYTMFGPENLKNNNELGLVQRCVHYLFDDLKKRSTEDNATLKDFKVFTKFIQLYREKLFDLLDSGAQTSSQRLKIRVDVTSNSPYIPGLKTMPVTSVQDVLQLVKVANGNRVVDATLMNAVSSRSHMIMILEVEQEMQDGSIVKSKLNFADLAGSETFDKALGGSRGNIDKKKLAELKTINLSLTQLTTCINFLSQGRNPSYRSSQLTFLLMDSLGGNSKTTLITACSPHIFNRSETIRTMRFAKTAKAVKNKAKVNKELSKAQLMKMIKKLQKENKKLKAQIGILKKTLEDNNIELPNLMNIEVGGKKKSRRKSKSKLGKHRSTNSLPFLDNNLSFDKKKQNEKKETKETENPHQFLKRVSSMNLDDLKNFKKQKFNKSNSTLENIDEGKVKLTNSNNISSGLTDLMIQLKELEQDLENQKNNEEELKHQLRLKENELNTLSDDIESLREENNNISEDLEEIKLEKDRLEKKILESHKNISNLKSQNKKEINILNENINTLQLNLNNKNTKINELEQLVETFKFNNEQLTNENKNLNDEIKDIQEEMKLNEDKQIKEETLKKEKEEKDKINKNFELKQSQFLNKYFKIPVNKEMNNIKKQEKLIEKTDNELNEVYNDMLSAMNKWTSYIGMNKVNKDLNNNNVNINNNNKQLLKDVKNVVHYLNSAVKHISDESLNHKETLNNAIKTRDDRIKKLQEEYDKNEIEYKNEIYDKNKKIKELQDELNKVEIKTPRHKAHLTSLNNLHQHHITPNLSSLKNDNFDFTQQLEYLDNIGDGLGLEWNDPPPLIINDENDFDFSNGIVGKPAPWRKLLRVGSKLDCLDEGQLWWTAKVVNVEGDILTISYDGFDSRWDEKCNRNSVRLARYLTKAKGGKGSQGVSVQLEVVAERHGKNVYKQGFLEKQGGTFKTFKNRFFVLMEDGYMYYYKKITDDKPHGKININEMTETRKLIANKKNIFGFEIVTKKRVWRFRAESEEIVMDWVSIIHALSAGLKPNEDELESAIVYDGYDPIRSIESSPKSAKKTNFNLNKNNTMDKTKSIQSIHQSLMTMPGIVPPKRNSLLSVQEERSNHPPLTRADFERMEQSNNNNNNSEDDEIEFRNDSDNENNNKNDILIKYNNETMNKTRNTNNNQINKKRRNTNPPPKHKPPPKPRNKPEVVRLDDRTVYESKVHSSSNSSNSSSTSSSNSSIDSIEEQKINNSNINRSIIDNAQKPEMEGWMHKQGKWQANWTLRYCSLYGEPKARLVCYTDRKDGRKTHEILLKRVKAVQQFTPTEEKLKQMELPTVFAFELVTMHRTYTFACKSGHILHMWTKHIRKIKGLGISQKRFREKKSSLRVFGSMLHKSAKSFGRFLNLTEEYVPVSEVLRKEDVKVKQISTKFKQRHNSNTNNSGVSSRRASVPVVITHNDLLGLEKLNNNNENGKLSKSRHSSIHSIHSVPKNNKNRRLTGPSAYSGNGTFRPLALNQINYDPLAGVQASDLLVLNKHNNIKFNKFNSLSSSNSQQNKEKESITNKEETQNILTLSNNKLKLIESNNESNNESENESENENENNINNNLLSVSSQIQVQPSPSPFSELSDLSN